MAIQRKTVGAAEKYRGYAIEARFVGPDLVACVDGEELSTFYLNRNAALTGAKKHVDELTKIEQKKESRNV